MIIACSIINKVASCPTIPENRHRNASFISCHTSFSQFSVIFCSVAIIKVLRLPRHFGMPLNRGVGWRKMLWNTFFVKKCDPFLTATNSLPIEKSWTSICYADKCMCCIMCHKYLFCAFRSTVGWAWCLFVLCDLSPLHVVFCLAPLYIWHNIWESCPG